LFASAGFGSKPPEMDLQVMTLIPANIVDRAGAGGGTPVLNLRPLPQPQPAPAPPPQTVQTEQVDHVEIAMPPPRKEIVRPRPQPDEAAEMPVESKPKISKPAPKHEIHPTYALADAKTSAKKTEKSTSSASPTRTQGSRKKEIENALSELALGVRSSGSPDTIVDVEGIGGGAAFAGYRDVVYSAYYRAWIADSASSRAGTVDAKVTIARDGSIISAELVSPSDDRALNKSVERVLRAVTKLPPFPASTQDTQRTFIIRFDPTAKELAG
jgi:TonB family protein